MVSARNRFKTSDPLLQRERGEGRGGGGVLRSTSRLASSFCRFVRRRRVSRASQHAASGAMCFFGRERCAIPAILRTLGTLLSCLRHPTAASIFCLRHFELVVWRRVVVHHSCAHKALKKTRFSWSSSFFPRFAVLRCRRWVQLGVLPFLLPRGSDLPLTGCRLPPGACDKACLRMRRPSSNKVATSWWSS